TNWLWSAGRNAAKVTTAISNGTSQETQPLPGARSTGLRGRRGGSRGRALAAASTTCEICSGESLVQSTVQCLTDRMSYDTSTDAPRLRPSGCRIQPHEPAPLEITRHSC